MRKMLQYLLIGSLILSSALVVYAQNVDTDYGYVIVKCTVTVDVDVLDEQATAYFRYEGPYYQLGTNETYVSTTSIKVQNLSGGAILKYAVFVSEIQRNQNDNGSGSWIPDTDNQTEGIKGWTLSTDDTPGICEFVLYAVFANARPSSDDFADANDRLAMFDPDYRSANTYRVGNDKFGPETTSLQYPTALSGWTGANYIAPYPEENYARDLWFKIKTPTAVTDERPRRIVIRVDGGISTAW